VAGQLAACHSSPEYDRTKWANEWTVQCELLRDIFPFRPFIVDGSWLTPQVLHVAKTIYEGQEFGRMSELAQVLHKAGCAEKELLHHCLWSGDHTRGCWALDAVLGKQ
jgi:hypothetical protein